jgi:hypothetical protein
MKEKTTKFVFRFSGKVFWLKKVYDPGHMERGGHRLPKVSLESDIPYPSTLRDKFKFPLCKFLLSFSNSLTKWKKISEVWKQFEEIYKIRKFASVKLKPFRNES